MEQISNQNRESTESRLELVLSKGGPIPVSQIDPIQVRCLPILTFVRCRIIVLIKRKEPGNEGGCRLYSQT